MKKKKGSYFSKKDSAANDALSNTSEGSLESINSLCSLREFKNLYWTRVISLNIFKEEQDHVFSIEEDYEIENLGF